ncbi:TIGR03118 family protein [Undibacterium sp. CY7W]|uniref:TIGR03118 family protein n=1 Tax=Undibacterium rugosum TaxID=2762291 RepID=A0A923I3H9_9BURK|nr:TIGR03118 family protein [Undibacterium rugosum]
MKNNYTATNFVATSAAYNPTFATDANFADAWGIAIRPPGAGGHFWVTAGNATYEYQGDVNGQPLSQDALKKVALPGGGRATGTVYNGTATSFVLTQSHPNGDITAGAKFLFATDSGVISAWTERKKSDGSYDRPDAAKIVIDQSAQGVQFFGLAINPTYDRLYAANFGTNPGVKVFDANFNDISATVKFTNPFAVDTNNVKPGEYAPFNVQVLGNSVFVAYAQTSEDPAAPGHLLAATEVHAPGSGRLAEFDLNGKLIGVWNDGGKLNAPWGLVITPANFGLLSNTLLVGNFGEGTIVAFDRTTHAPVNYVRAANGAPLVVPGIWGLIFGNGVALGDTNALYFASGPEDEKGGVFGSIRYTPVKK